MKLESLESKRITNLNGVLGGVNGITDGTNNFTLPQPKSASCSGGCTVTVGSGGVETAGGKWSYDY